MFVCPLLQIYSPPNVVKLIAAKAKATIIMIMADEPVPLNPPAAGQEPPFVGPTESDAAPSNSSNNHNDSSAGDDDTNNAGAVPNPPPPRSPRGGGGIRLQINPEFPGRVNITSSSGRRTININASGSGPVPVSGRVNFVHPRRGTNRNNVNNAQQGGRQMPMMGPGGPVLPPLEPQPMPNQTSDEGGNDVPETKNEDGSPRNNSSMNDMKKFECAICCEYMDCPVGCGNDTCQTRFCHPCLSRVFRQEMLTSQNPESVEPPKCPNCRSFFTLQSMTPDIALKKEIRDCTETVSCPYKGCNMELGIRLLKSHEAQCPYIRMRCRFADWGCEWVGTKKDLADHETHHCEFRCGLGKLVERFRQGDTQVMHLLQQHHMQITATSQMLSLHSRQMMMIRGKNAGNVVDVLQMAYEASMFPGRFSAMRDTWSSLTNQPARFAVCNVLLMVPSIALVLHVALIGFKLLFNLQIDTLSEDDVWYLVDTLLLSLITSLLGILCIACFFVDAKSPLDWTIYSVRNIIPGQPVLRDLAAICMAMTHFSAIEFSRTYSGVILWHCTTVVTIFFTSFVSCIIEKNDSASGVGIMNTARAWPVVIFGLRYGLAAALCGCGPCINAVVALRLLKRYMPTVSRKVTAEDSECFISQLGVGYLIALAGFSTAWDYAYVDVIPWWGALLDFILAATVLAYVNALVLLLNKFGIKLGETNFHAGNKIFMQAHRASGAVLPNMQPSPLGCAVFGGCSFLLLCIAIA